MMLTMIMLCLRVPRPHVADVGRQCGWAWLDPEGIVPVRKWKLDIIKIQLIL